MDDANDPLLRLQILQRDLVAFAESRLNNVERLSMQLDASTEDIRKLLSRNRKSDASRKTVAGESTPPPRTLKIDDVEYEVRELFRQNALSAADALDLDELEAAMLCIRSQISEEDSTDSMAVAMRAVLLFHEQRQVLLDCLRLVLHLSSDADIDEAHRDAFKAAAKTLIQGESGGHTQGSAFWRKCLEGLTDSEDFIAKVAAENDKALMTGENLSGSKGQWLVAQRLLLTRQHESLACITSYLVREHYVLAEDYRSFLSKAAVLEAPTDITFHYLTGLVTGAEYFASDHTATPETARGLHSLFAAGPGQLQWRNSSLKAAATVCWLAEYSARFSSDLTVNEVDRARDEEARSKLFLDALKDKAFNYILAAASFLRPIVWHDPARAGFITFLVNDLAFIPVGAPRPSDEFSDITMRDFQTFTDAFVTNMPDTLRKLKVEEDDRRRNILSQSMTAEPTSDYDLERFMVIIACAYQDDAEAVRDFWADRESNLYGFLRWTSQRLPTPRVSAFCMLLKSVACDEKSANQAHRLLLEDTVMSSGKMRKAYAMSWTQIFSELELYASSLKDRPSNPQVVPGQDRNAGELTVEEPETNIMLESYLGLAAHICRTSPDARTWLLKEQTFHLGEVMFQLVRSANTSRTRACCLDLLAALLTDKVVEVRNGMWVLLDSWVSSGGLDGSAAPRLAGRPQYSAKYYLAAYANDPEAAASMTGFLNALIAPTAGSSELPIDQLPFPEALGRPHRHEGIHAYVDFVMDAVFARKVPYMVGPVEKNLVDVVRFECLQFAFQCLVTFNEDIFLLANTTNVEVDAAMETKSYAKYASLHPFARVMEWLFDKNVAASLFATIHQNLDGLNDANPGSPLVQATLKSLQLLSLAWKLQPTYFDLVRPAIQSQTHKAQPVSSTWTSIDEIFLTHLDTVVDIADLTACQHVDISLECMALLQKIGSSRKLSETAEARYGSRIISVLTPVSGALTVQLAHDFQLFEWDLETDEMPLKVVKAKAVIELLEASLKASSRAPTMAHCLLGLHCRERAVEVLPGSPFDKSKSLFNSIAECAAQAPTITPSGNMSWLLALKRGCLEVLLELATSPLTARIVQPILRAMDFLGAISKNLAPASLNPMWDGKTLDQYEVLVESSSFAVRDFMHVREAFFEFASLELRNAAEQGAYSVQEKIVGVLLGTVKLPTGEEVPTTSVFELFDFFDLETKKAFVLESKTFQDDNVASCTKDDPETLISYDIDMAHMYLTLRKKQLKENGTIKETDEKQADDDIQGILASLTSQNNFAAIQSARLAALEAWTDLLSLIVTKGGMEQTDVIALSLQGLLVTLPKFEKSLADNMDAGALLAKLTLTLTHAIIPASQGSSEQTASVAIERLLTTFRVSLKVMTDSSTDLGLRDVSYRTCCAVLASLPSVPAKGRNSQAASARQLLQLVQNAGERLFTVVTEDTFSGRGVTRVSALLFLDGLISLFQSLKVNTQMLRALMKLNFVPVLIDTSIGNVGNAFKSDDETIATMAYFHTAMALLLRLCQTSDGTQLVVNSGLFAGIEDSRLFTTDPDIGLDIDNPTALKEFYAFLADVVRLMTATVVQKGAQLARAFLQQHRFTVQAILKQATRGQALDAADELCKLIMATGFLEDDQAAAGGISTNGFT